MTHTEAERAILLQVPVVHRGVEYLRLSGLIYRKDTKSGGLIARGELFSSCGHSVTIARLDLVNWLHPEDEELPTKEPDSDEREPTFQEVQAKKAFLAGEELLYQGGRWRITAIILRQWMDRAYWMSLELVRSSDRKALEVWVGSLSFPAA